MLRPHRLRLTGLIFLLLATSASRGWGQSDQRIATVLVVTGVAEVRASGEATWDQLRFRDAIFARDTVRTAANSRVKFLMRDDAILTLGEDGEMEFTEFLLTQQQCEPGAASVGRQDPMDRARESPPRSVGTDLVGWVG